MSVQVELAIMQAVLSASDSFDVSAKLRDAEIDDRQYARWSKKVQLETEWEPLDNESEYDPMRTGTVKTAFMRDILSNETHDVYAGDDHSFYVTCKYKNTKYVPVIREL